MVDFTYMKNVPGAKNIDGENGSLTLLSIEEPHLFWEKFQYTKPRIGIWSRNKQ